MIIQGFFGDYIDLEPQILELHNLIFPYNQKKTLNELCGKYHNTYWFLYVNDDDNKVVGMATTAYCIDKLAYHLYNIGVHPEFRNQGVLRELERSIKQHYPSSSLFGEIHKNNRVAKKIFKKMGATLSAMQSNDKKTEIWSLRTKKHK